LHGRIGYYSDKSGSRDPDDPDRDPDDNMKISASNPKPMKGTAKERE